MSYKTDYLEAVGEYFHVYNRGVNRSPIFLQQRNYPYLLQRVENNLSPLKLSIIAYCLMPNHFHFILRQDARHALSEFMSAVCDGYAKAINKQESRSGHLFEGKYKLKHIDDQAYLLHLSRYIHLNPVAAGLVEAPEEWEYSSYREYYGLRNSSFVSTEVILSQFQDRADYVRFVKEYRPEDREKIKKYLMG